MPPTYVRGLNEPLSANEYAQLEGLDEKDVIDRIHALGGVYSLGWYLEAPPYTEERFARLRAEPKLEPRLLNWLQRRADLHDNPQYKSEVERLRVHFIKSDPWFNTLPTADQSALVTTKRHAQVPQPVDYGLSRPDVCVHRGRYPLDDGLKYQEGESHEWLRIFLVALALYGGLCGVALYLNGSGQLKGDSTELWKVAIALRH